MRIHFNKANWIKPLKKKIAIFYFIFLLSSFYAQSKINPNEEIIGVILTDNNPVLITKTGYYQIQNRKDAWEEYYQKIYNDSTIINPNTELKGNYTINITPYVLSGSENYQNYYFEEPLQLGMLISIGENNNYSFTNYGLSIFDSLSTKQNKKLFH